MRDGVLRGSLPGTPTARQVDVLAAFVAADARGFTDADLAEGICRSSMAQLAEWTLAAEKVVTF